ncbi:MAG: DM13 domain-containing protein [Patescibacteria group bacterium]
MKKILIVIGGLAVLAFLWWTVSPLFIIKEVNDELSPELQALLDQQAAEIEELPTPTPAAQEALNRPANIVPGPPAEDGSEAVEVVRESQTAPKVVEAVDSEAEAEAPTPAVQGGVSGPFSIIDTPTHPAEGSVRVLEAGGQSIVRFEDYDGTNGPDLFVYLAKDLDADEFVNLGRAKGNMGNINYEVPDDVDVSEYKYVMTWCRAFGVLFDYAEIN